uniref:Uncharacterized protein n=1 Tax=Arundo donax TaxID=35708 RepID=A0A0A9F0F2_ARUDO
MRPHKYKVDPVYVNFRWCYSTGSGSDNIYLAGCICSVIIRSGNLLYTVVEKYYAVQIKS